jgi:nucleotide-binding universal stress UspA family protein
VVVPIAIRAFIEVAGVAQESLDEIAHGIAAASGVPAVAHRRAGQAVEELGAYAAEEGIDLIVMATHGWGGLQRSWLGSVTVGLIREARVPVVAFRPEEEAEARVDGQAIDHLLIPLDGSALAEAILPQALALGGPEARYTLVRVVPVGEPVTLVSRAIEVEYRQELLDGLLTGAAQYLDEIATRLRADGYEVGTEVLTDPQPAKAILDYAAEVGAELITLATRGRSGLARFALGSVADKVLRGADTPVMVLRPEGADAEEEAGVEERANLGEDLVGA